MNNKLKNNIIIACFMCIIYGFMLGGIFSPDKDISYSERRVLAKSPSYSWKKLVNGEYFKEYERYLLDQFILREELRGIKAFTRFNIFNQKDNNKIYIVDGVINKIEYPLNEKAIINAANKLNEVYQKYLQGKNVSYAIIPDKNYFIATEKGYLSLDYDKLLELMEQNVRGINYIDVFYGLSLEDYYKTDIHWSQDRIVGIADLLLEKMNNKAYDDVVKYNEKLLYPFYGSYYGQAALRLEPDTLMYLTNEMIENAVVYDHIDKTYSMIYEEDEFGTIDSYNIYLSGAKSILTITNPMPTTDKELVIFRDSFGSSIAPLLLKGYAKITLVDLRYMRSDLLGDYIDFSGDQDVLFLYNTMILNNSYMLK